MRRKPRFHNLKRPKFRQTWNKINLYNLSRMSLPPSADKTYFQQKWHAKALTRAYHGEQIREKQWQRMFRRTAPSVVPLDHKYLAHHDGSELAAGRGSGLDVRPGQDRRLTPKIPYMHMVYHPTERRLDTAIFRALFASSARQARQFVTHGHVKVNGKSMIYPGYQLNPGDMFQVDVDSVLFATGARKGTGTSTLRKPKKKEADGGKADGGKAENEETAEGEDNAASKAKADSTERTEASQEHWDRVAWIAAMHGDTPYMRGDWKCGNESCGQHNTRESKQVCPKCDELKSRAAFIAKKNGMYPPDTVATSESSGGDLLGAADSEGTEAGESKGAEAAETGDKKTAAEDDILADPKKTLAHLLARAKGILSGPTNRELRAKQKQDVRAFRYAVKRVLSRSKDAAATGLTDDLEAQFLLLTQQLALSDPSSSSSSSVAPRETKRTKGPQELEKGRRLLQDALRRAQENPLDRTKPYRTPWEPREYMSAFAFIPRYLEVNQNICSAVYLRHPVARPGLAEVPTPFHAETSQLAFNWYLRRR